QEKRLGWVARESHVVFADSKATADDLAQYYPISPEKIAVNYPGIAHAPPPPHDLYELARIRERYKIPGDYILTVGKQEPRKNMQRLIEAVIGITMKQSNNVSLIVVGPPGWGETVQSPDPRIIFAGYVADEELPQLYQYAKAFVYPSLSEGFGYPVVE